MAEVKYSPIVGNGCRHDEFIENGMTPVDSPQLENGSPYKDTKRQRTLSVNTVTQTANGSIIKIPTLHIPGETGELAGLSAELDNRNAVNGNGSLEKIAPEKLKQIYAQIKAKKIKYKLVFSTSVITMLIVAYASVLFPWFLPYYHSAVFPLLYIIRLIVYTKSHWQLFCLDFCYVANLALLVFFWALPTNESFFGVVFGVVVGPVAVATFVFRNSIVFHDYDRMTSAYIHLVPNIAVYILKWYPEDTSKYWYFHPEHTFNEVSMQTNSTGSASSVLPDGVDPTWVWIVAIPLTWFILHTVLFMLVENFCFTDKKYLTSYRWLSSSIKLPIYQVLTLGGRVTSQNKVKTSWLLFNILYGVLSVLIARLCYQYQVAHTVYIIFIHTLAIYNGASFYIDVFAKRGLEVAND